MVLRVEQGKGGRDPEVPLSPTLLAALREHYRWIRPQTYLFPGTHNGWRADAPITAKVIWEAVRLATRQGRHREAGYTADAAALVRDAAPGSRGGPAQDSAAPRPRRPVAHTVYLHLSQRHLQAAPNPLEQLKVLAPVVLPRCRLKRKPSPA